MHLIQFGGLSLYQEYCDSNIPLLRYLYECLEVVPDHTNYCIRRFSILNRLIVSKKRGVKVKLYCKSNNKIPYVFFIFRVRYTCSLCIKNRFVLHLINRLFR